MSREQIYAAVFSLASNAANFVTKSRNLVSIDAVNSADLPALFQEQVLERIEQGARGVPPRKILEIKLHVYVGNFDAGVSVSTQLNGLLDALELALAADSATGVQTLGGLVSHCWVEGKLEIFEGNAGEKARAVVPVRVLVA